MQKPLYYETIKNTPRFKRFSDKIVHFIQDDSHLAIGKWASEKSQERLRYDEFMIWNNISGHYPDDAMIGFGDADEMYSCSLTIVRQERTYNY
jgi:hypothetical protein